MPSVASASSTTASSPSDWWYGVAMFPLTLITSLLPVVGFIGVHRLVSPENPSVYMLLLGVFLFAQGASMLLGVIVAGALVLDIHELQKTDSSWHPHWAWVAPGVVNIAGPLFSPAFVVSVPLLSYYLYRRGKRVGAPSFGF
ncbi:hypothetical protein [Haloferax larsenii]|uniref:Uncharacterized protein n=1 Tax=Haloferax larsenii TaxID=302484 RepID=A0A1H7L971_HALLR|nr:hypothetical protein [Haloferax larsenii]SEK95593.1 hypothetical protein SAMN04488691_102255 [Haloferax larsenii]